MEVSLGRNRRPHWSCSSLLWYPSAAWVFKVPKLKRGRAGGGATARYMDMDMDMDMVMDMDMDMDMNMDMDI